MTREQISEALGEISALYVEEALTGTGRNTARPRGLFRVGLAAAVIAGVLMLTTGAVFLLKPVLRTYFGESTACVYQKNSQILNLSQTVDGWTMTLTDCIGDDNRLYVGIEVTAPEGTVLMEQGAPLPYGIEEIDIDVGEGARHPGAWYISQIPDDSETDNHLRFVLWMNCQESLDGKNLSLTLGKLSHGNGVCDFDGSWSFQDIQLDLADQSIRLEPQVSVPVLDTTATLTELTISPVSITCCFRGEGLIGQRQRYPNGTNITDPAIALYDHAGNVMQLETRRAPFGSRAGSGDNNATGELRIVQGYETFIDLEALDRIEICGVDIQIGK